MRLRVYANPRYVAKDDCLCPLLLPKRGQYPGQTPWEDDLFDSRWDAYFELTAKEDSDVLVFPAALSEANLNTAAQAAAEARAAGRKLLVFEMRDDPLPLQTGSEIIFRAGLSQSTKAPHEYALPAFVSDRQSAPMAPSRPGRSIGKKPVVGFCGNLDAAAGARFRIQKLLGRAVCWGLPHTPGWSVP